MLSERLPRAIDNHTESETGLFFDDVSSLTRISALSAKAVLFLYSMKRRGFKVKKKKSVCPFLRQPNRVTWRRTTPLTTTVRPSHPLAAVEYSSKGNSGELSLQVLLTVKINSVIKLGIVSMNVVVVFNQGTSRERFTEEDQGYT